jgi:hypothetical protein
VTRENPTQGSGLGLLTTTAVFFDQFENCAFLLTVQLFEHRRDNENDPGIL